MKKKYLGLVAVALFGATSVSGSVMNNVKPTLVKADDPKPTLWLTKKTPYLVAKNGETVKSLIKHPIRDVTSNKGKVTKLEGIAIYHNMDNGDPDYTKAMSKSAHFKAGQGYSAVLTFAVKNADKFERLVQVEPFEYDDHYISDLESSYQVPEVSIDDCASIVVPIKVTSSSVKVQSSVSKVNLRGYVKGKKNSKVKTYTAAGKATKHYIYGKHTYKLNQKKTIKGKTYYKISGKSYWIPATKLVLK